VLKRLLGLAAVELLVSVGILWLAFYFGADFPIPLVISYALFRTFEYYSIKTIQVLVADPMPGAQPTILGLTTMLFLARVAGWGMFIFFAYKAGVWNAIAFIGVAFPLSLVFQTIYDFTIRPMERVGPLLTFSAVPILVVVIFLQIRAI
jgi:hypothetical protein